MNILLINHYAGSVTYGMELRPYYMAKEWVNSGLNVTILASSFSHLRRMSPKMKSDIREDNIDGINYIWFKTPKYKDNGVKRVINIFTFLFKLYKYRKYIIKKVKPDVVIASSTYTLDIYPAYKFAKFSNALLIYEVHDLWPLSPIELGGMSPRHPFIVMLQAAEDFAYKKADYIVSMLPKAYTHMTEHGMDIKKFVYIPNGIATEEWHTDITRLPEEHKKILKKLKEQNKLLIAYVGAHGIANALDSLVESASLLDDDDIIVLVGQGPEKEKLMRKAADKKLKNILFLGPVPHDAVPELLSYMDILFLSLKRQPLFKYGISPNKLMDYMMACKPIIQAIEAGNDIVSESKSGISIKPEDPKEIVKAVKYLKSLSNEELDTMGRNAKDYVLKNHDYKVLSHKFIDVFMKKKDENIKIHK